MPVPAFALLAVLLAPVDPARAVIATTITEADAMLSAAKLPAGERDYSGALARKAALDPDRLAGYLDAISTACPAPSCPPLQDHADLPDRLVRAIAELGAAKHAPSLMRSTQSGTFESQHALDRLRLRLMIDALPTARCQPPTAAEISAQSTTLADFLVLRVRAGVLTAEPLQPHERSDLAYFLAAVADAGREVGAPAEASRSNPNQPAATNPTQTTALAQLKSATRTGDLAGALAAGKRYLATLGYPRPMNSAADAEYAWGGARHSFVMRDMAKLAELTGDLPLALDLHRRADPGGGMCGTSYSSYWTAQVGGVIRSAERLGDCRPALAERLLDVDFDDSSITPAPDPRGLGTGRLAAAGFDVPRLFRGAMLTLGRDDEPALRRALEAAPAPLRSAALARLARRGSEDWSRRVHAIEGLAATGDATTLTRLAAQLPTLVPTDLERAAATIGAAARRPGHDPCAPSDTISLGGISSQWSRTVPMLAHTCARSLTLAQSQSLARALLPLLAHRDLDVQSAAVLALGELAVELARPPLQKLARATPMRPCDDDDTCAEHRRHDAAVEALENFDDAVRDPAWRRHDHLRGR